MSYRAGYYHQCPGCGRSFGRGKGWGGLARHDCDEIRPALARFLNAEVGRNQLAVGFARTREQIDALFWSLLP